MGEKFSIKVIANICLVALTVIAICVIIAFGYYHFFVKDLVIGVNSIDNQNGLDIKKIDDLTEEEKNKYNDRWFLEANYYSNDKDNGVELQELNFNYFKTYKLTSDEYRSTGMQYLGDYEHHSVSVSNDSERDNYVFEDFYYYDTTDGISYNGYAGNNASTSTALKRKSSFTIKIDNRAFEIKLDKYYKTGWWIFGSTHYYTYSELFQSVFNAIKSNSKGYGDYFITVNLSDFFTVYEYNEDGKFKADDVSDIIKNYAVLKFHYDENGAISSKQSLFGSIECNRNWGKQDVDVDTTYWQERYVYNLSEQNLMFRYSENYNGYFASISIKTKELFVKMPRAKVKFTINLNSQYLLDNEINIIGFDYSAFENFEIDTFTIIGNSQKIYLLEKSFYDTNLQFLKYSNGITFDIGKDAFNNDYMGVVL